MKRSNDDPPPVRHYQRQCRAAFYAMYLREIEGYSRDEAEVLVRERYPDAVRAIKPKGQAKGAGA